MPPLSLLVKPVSGLCNMRCPYCFYADEMRRREVALRGPMTPDTAEKIVRRAFAFADGEVAFAFQGGRTDAGRRGVLPAVAAPGGAP